MPNRSLRRRRPWAVVSIAAFLALTSAFPHRSARRSFLPPLFQSTDNDEPKPGTYSGRFLEDNGLEITTDPQGVVTARPPPEELRRIPITDAPVQLVPQTGYNVVLTHCTADFDSLASAVALAKVWTATSTSVPTFVVLPRGAHPGVQRFLALHKHLFPIRSLKSLPKRGLQKLALVDAQRRDRLGPAEPLIDQATSITVVDHHVDQESDIPADEYVVDRVGSVSTIMVERLQATPNSTLTEAEATLLALGIHADTGSLCFDSTTARDAFALAWCLSMGASQSAIAEHAQSSLSSEQQGVLTQALLQVNTTDVHGVKLSTCLLSADGFINGLAAVTQDALELSSSDIFLLAVVYEAKRKKTNATSPLLTSRLLRKRNIAQRNDDDDPMVQWKAAFDRADLDGDGTLDLGEVASVLSSSGVVASEASINSIMHAIDADGDGRITLDEFLAFAQEASEVLEEDNRQRQTMIIIGRVKAGVSLKGVKLHHLLEPLGGGGHAKAASATVRLRDESEAVDVLQDLVDQLVETSLTEQPTVGDFMTAPVLSVQPEMTEQQVEDLFRRFDVRALPVVDDHNDVIGLVTYKEVAAAKQRLWNKEQKRIRDEQKGKVVDRAVANERKKGSTVKAWMLQHVKVVEASHTMAQVESLLLESDVGCIPVVADGTKQLVGMVTRTDLLRQHRYYPSLHYHNKYFTNSIAARQPIIELRKRLKRFDEE